MLLPWPSAKAGEIWPHVEPLLRKAIELNRGYLSEDVLVAIMDQRMQLFVIAENDEPVGAIVTEIHVYPRSKALFLLFIGGSRLPEWPMNELWNWGRIMGCDWANGVGRKGFGRYVFTEEASGFEFFEKHLGDGHE